MLLLILLLLLLLLLFRAADLCALTEDYCVKIFLQLKLLTRRLTC